MGSSRGSRSAPFPWGSSGCPCIPERSCCLESVWQGLPYILAWLVPVLTLLGQLVARGTSVTDIAPRPIEPIVPGKGNSSNETYSLYCSSCLLLIHRAQDICYQYVGRKDVGLEGKIIFFLYLLLVLSCCTLLYRRVKLRCRRNAGAPLLGLERDGFAGRSVRSVSQVSHNFQLVFLLCWAPAFLLTLLSFTSIKPASVYVLYVATAVTVPLQGFLHSLVYGWLRQNFRQEAAGETPSPQPRRGGCERGPDQGTLAAS
ncbi:putative LOC102092104 [Columba livia]|uniref:Putative LOC102092104 n=1 Tax=Columba livia TaxID=8932 RepID=A0A2I0LKH1_COLLI|nr:putative LOC102092104 [Columba livia]